MWTSSEAHFFVGTVTNHKKLERKRDLRHCSFVPCLQQWLRRKTPIDRVSVSIPFGISAVPAKHLALRLGFRLLYQSVLLLNDMSNEFHDKCAIQSQQLTKTRQQSTKQNVPDRPMPAEQCTTGGPTFSSSTPESRTCLRNCRKAIGLAGTPKSGHCKRLSFMKLSSTAAEYHATHLSIVKLDNLPALGRLNVGNSKESLREILVVFSLYKLHCQAGIVQFQLVSGLWPIEVAFDLFLLHNLVEHQYCCRVLFPYHQPEVTDC